MAFGGPKERSPSQAEAGYPTKLTAKFLCTAHIGLEHQEVEEVPREHVGDLSDGESGSEAEAHEWRLQVQKDIRGISSRSPFMPYTFFFNYIILFIIYIYICVPGSLP